MNKVAAEKIALEYYNIGVQHALGHTKQANIAAIKNLLKGGTRKGINVGTGIGLGATGANLGIDNMMRLIHKNAPNIAKSEFGVSDKALKAFNDFMGQPQLEALGVNWYGNTLPLLAAATGGGALGIHAAKKLNLGKKLVG